MRRRRASPGGPPAARTGAAPARPLPHAGGAVHVWLAGREDAAAQCSECQTACPIYDHREREWRHLDTCQLQTRLHARVPRVECPTHGVVQSAVPWATPGSKYTLLFERLAIDWLREAAVTAVARQLKLGWDAVWGIERRAVARGLERRGTLELRYVGVDEKSFQRQHDGIGADTPFEGLIFRGSAGRRAGRGN